MVSLHSFQGSSSPFVLLNAPGASSGQTSVRAVEEPGLPLENLPVQMPLGQQNLTEEW
jgi:hypothetical protein